MDASLHLEGGIRFIFISEEIYCYLYIQMIIYILDL